MPSKRQRIVSKILTAVQGISADNGYETNIGENVFDWITDFQEDELPGTSVCDMKAERIENLCQDFLDFFKLTVQIRTAFSGSTRAEEARKIEKDIIQSLKQFDGAIYDGTEKLAGDVNLAGSGFVLAEDGFAVVAVAVELELTFYTKRFDAYE